MFRVVLAFVVLGSACYDPKLGSPSFYCHPGDNPACPDGQVCDATINRCVRSGHGTVIGDGGASINDAGSGGGGDGGGGTDGGGVGTGMVGCRGYAQCLQPCTTTSCQSACDSKVTSSGKMLFNTALACGQEWCLGPNDPNGPMPGPGDCDIDILTNTLIDAAGKPAGACDKCLQNATAGLFGIACPQPSSSNCNPSICTSKYASCQADAP